MYSLYGFMDFIYFNYVFIWLFTRILRRSQMYFTCTTADNKCLRKWAFLDRHRATVVSPDLQNVVQTFLYNGNVVELYHCFCTVLRMLLTDISTQFNKSATT